MKKRRRERYAVRDDVMRGSALEHPHISFAVVLAYLPVSERSFEEGVPTMYPEGLELVPRRFAIKYRNRWMVEHADIILAYVNRGYGGAAQTLSYAARRGLEIINLAENS